MAETGKTPLRVLLLAAHPHDEFGVAATLREHVHDGDRVFAAWFARDDRPEVGEMRRSEARKAMMMAGVPLANLRFPQLDAVALPAQLPQLVEAVKDVVAELRPDLAYVPAFEGGHPDHDAVNFAAWEGAALSGVETREYPVYHATERKMLARVPVFGRLLPGIGEPAVRTLSGRESRFKRSLWKIYRSQLPLFGWLLRASGDEAHVFTTEETRPLPLRDYTKPPHTRPLLYEQHPDIPYSFDEFSSAVRRYQWGGGVEEHHPGSR